MRLSRRRVVKSLGLATGLMALGKARIVSAADQSLAGTYKGTLSTGSINLRLMLVIAPDNSATLFSVDQGNTAIPANVVKIEGKQAAFVFTSIGASYDARLSGGSMLAGTFTQNGFPLPLKLTRGEAYAPDPPLMPLTQAGLVAYRQASGTPALGAAWNRIGKPMEQLVDGLRSSTSTAPVTLNDKWHLGSMTKSMTATLVARLVEMGLVSWNDTVSGVLGRVLPNIKRSYADATLLHLLSHHSGLPKDIPMDALVRFTRDGLADPRAERLRYAGMALAMPPVARLGENMVYANNGYVVVGAMLEQLTSEPWERLITQHLFAPLGLSSAGFGPPGRQDANEQPSGHALGPEGTRMPHFLDNPVALGPAGRVHMNLADLITYLSAHRDRPKALLSTESWAKLHTPPFGGNYALGWFAAPDGALWHNGTNSIWYAEAIVDRANGVVAAFVSNDTSFAGGAPGKVLKTSQMAAMR
jgi:CubicO group peptidase (beta-lactamase class C family)